MLRKIIVSLLILATTAVAETIHLKNGRTILADTAHEVNGRVEYTIGENSFAIQKSSVDRIDTGGTPIVTPREQVTLPPAEDDSTLKVSPDLNSRIVHNGKVDIEALGKVEQQGNNVDSAVANYFASQHERSAGSLETALRYLERARSFLPDNANLAGHYASLLLQIGRFTEAAAAAERTIQLAPKSASGYTVLGYVLYQQGKMKRALQMLTKSLELEPDESVKAFLQKVQRETNAEGEFNEENSSHFTMRYEGGQAAVPLRRQILEVLERDYDDLVRDLDFAPQESIQVILYTDKQFFDVTQAPKWTGALNDGKLRIPISGLTAVSTDFSRVLKHELTHSFINMITRGRAPTWLHEGVAQIEEPRSASGDGHRLSLLYSAGRNIPLNELEGPFVRFTVPEATVAYAQSLLTVEYIREVYGMSSVTFVLKHIGEGQSTEAALRSTVHSGYEQLQREMTDWLRRTYGD